MKLLSHGLVKKKIIGTYLTNSNSFYDICYWYGNIKQNYNDNSKFNQDELTSNKKSNNNIKLNTTIPIIKYGLRIDKFKTYLDRYLQCLGNCHTHLQS